MKQDKENRAERDRDRSDRLAEQQARLLREFGGDAVLDPESGTVNIQESEKVRREREQNEALGEALGEQEAFTGIDIETADPMLRHNRGYARGKAKGAAKRAEEQFRLDKIIEAEKERTKRYTEQDKIRRESELEKFILEDALKEDKEVKKPKGVTVRKEGADGESFTYEIPMEEFLRREAERNAPPPPSQPFDDARKAAEEAQGKGEDVVLDFIDGKPVVKKDTIWRWSKTPQDAIPLIEAARKKFMAVQPRGTNAAPKAANVIPITDLIR
jgi:hypothetical protein